MIVFARRSGAKFHSKSVSEKTERRSESAFSRGAYDPAQSPLESTRRRQSLYNPVNWVNTRIQGGGDTCVLVDLLHGLVTITPMHNTEPGRVFAAKRSSVEVNSAVSPEMRVPWDPQPTTRGD